LTLRAEKPLEGNGKNSLLRASSLSGEAMVGKYHIETKPAPLHSAYPAKFRLGEGDEYVKYGRAALPPGRRGGDPLWTPQVITQIWYQAETGRIPISGAGYGGPFAGEGFDGMWLDMSEIVRPTRDGIHGREYISTAIDLGRRVPMLRFDPSGRLATPLPPLLEIPLPILFNPLPLPTPGRGARLAIAKAAARLGTFAFVEPEDWGDDLLPYAAHLAPRLSNLQSPTLRLGPSSRASADTSAEASGRGSGQASNFQPRLRRGGHLPLGEDKGTEAEGGCLPQASPGSWSGKGGGKPGAGRRRGHPPLRRRPRP